MNLTMREQEILAELAVGHDSYEEIAKRLGITPNTLNFHLKSMFRKTGSQNQIQLLRWGFREAKRAVAQIVVIEDLRPICECGRIATRQGHGAILSAVGYQKQVTIVLCGRCSAWFDGETTDL